MRLMKYCALTIALLASQAVYSEYVPDTIEFPAAQPIVFPSQPSLGLANGGAIEFWVAADWSEPPGYHPVILSNGSDASPAYRISIAASRDALIVQAGDSYGEFNFDFSDGKTHHVAMLDFDTEIAVVVDGGLVGAVTMSIQPSATGDFFVGSVVDGVAPFVGAVSAVRIWDVPLVVEEIAEFALKDVNDINAPHPNLENLVAYSDFQDGTFVIVDSYVIKESELMSEEEIIEVLGAAEVQAIDLELDEDEFDEDGFYEEVSDE